MRSNNSVSSDKFLSRSNCNSKLVPLCLSNPTTLASFFGAPANTRHSYTPPAHRCARGKLARYPIPVVGKLVKQGSSNGAEAVRTHFILGISHATQGIEHGCIRKGPGCRTDRRDKEVSRCRKMPVALSEFARPVWITVQCASASFSCAR